MGTGYMRKKIENKEINNQLFSLSNSFSLLYLLPSFTFNQDRYIYMATLYFWLHFVFRLLELDKQIDKNILYFSTCNFFFQNKIIIQQGNEFLKLGMILLRYAYS